MKKSSRITRLSGGVLIFHLIALIFQMLFPGQNRYSLALIANSALGVAAAYALSRRPDREQLAIWGLLTILGADVYVSLMVNALSPDIAATAASNIFLMALGLIGVILVGLLLNPRWVLYTGSLTGLAMMLLHAGAIHYFGAPLYLLWATIVYLPLAGLIYGGFRFANARRPPDTSPTPIVGRIIRYKRRGEMWIITLKKADGTIVRAQIADAPPTRNDVIIIEQYDIETRGENSIIVIREFRLAAQLDENRQCPYN